MFCQKYAFLIFFRFFGKTDSPNLLIHRTHHKICPKKGKFAVGAYIFATTIQTAVMPQFLKWIFASCLGTLLAVGAGIFILTAVASKAVSSASSDDKADIEPNSVLLLDFKVAVPDRTNNVESNPFELNQDDVLGTNDMIKCIQRAKDDADIKGIYFTAMDISTGKSSLQSLHRALVDFKTSGKFVVAYSDFYTQNAFYVASAADTLMLNPNGAVDFRGLSATYTYFKRMFDRLEVQPRVFYAGKFKSATEPFRYEKMSDENRLQVREYLDGMYDEYLNDMSAARGMDKAALRAAADRFDGLTAQKALASGLVDRVCYEDEALDLVRNLVGLDKKDKVRKVKATDYFTERAKKTDFSVNDKIAVVYAEGELTDGTDKKPGEIVSMPYVQMLRKIRLDDKVKALVLRVDSPGGSVMASDNILREIQLIKQSGKPVVVSMGDVAASGGYYIACQADSIFAEATTITGSIGVFAFIPVLQKTMENKLGITFDTVSTGRNSNFGSGFYDFNEEQSALLQTRVDHIYDDFITKVAAGRKMTKEQVHEIAQGRVWTGKRAKELHLVDEIGGLDRAIAAAGKLAGLEKYRAVDFPETKKGLELLMERFDKTKKEDAIVAQLKAELGEYYPLIQAMQQLRKSEGIQMRMPFEMIELK
jgi:protease IV